MSDHAMPDPALYQTVSELIFREARLLDAQSWDDWLQLYCEDAVFWVPAFRMDGSLTENPKTELNMIYFEGRHHLEERIFRLRTEIALSSTPVPRTTHVVGGVMIDTASATGIEAVASWHVAWCNDVRGSHLRAGSYEYLLRREPDGLRIARKKVLLLDPTIDGYFDVYAV